ncbi:FimD/PapC C-terminal domain-containing protein [Serratia fonticola]|uniref:FimD/PapC C-terminal domain-containing protein n=1 Tax=Serratia fonticola TaxID=47917 RepID=UPI00217A4073|nr:FimD/PapC C-terminal domain-containing protein [Serratia fonticola]CAI1241019.1 Outer membrane usher protein fimD precursor [Serratia fonticola]
MQVNIATHIVYQVLMTLIQKNQQPVPFGAIATLINMPIIDANASIVGDNGYIYLSSLPEKGQLRVKWGSQEGQLCVAQCDLSKQVLSPELEI